MAKTQWADGSYLTPAQLILFFGDDAVSGHTHNGLDADGSVPQIDSIDDIDFNTGTINVDVSSTYFTTPVNVDLYYQKVGNRVDILFPDIDGFHATNSQFQISPNTIWPAAVLPTSAFIFVGGLYMTKQDASAGEDRPGSLYITNVNTANWTGRIIDSNGVYDLNGFGTAGAGAGNEKGMRMQTVSYYVD